MSITDYDNTTQTDGTFATLGRKETLTNKTLTSPVLNTPTISSLPGLTLTGQLVAVDGSVGTPSIRGSDADTGFRFSGNNVYIDTGGAFTARFTSGFMLFGYDLSVALGSFQAQIQAHTTSSAAGFSSVRYTASAATCGRIALGHSNVTTLGTITAIQKNTHYLGAVEFYGAGATVFVKGAEIRAFTEGASVACTDTDMPTALGFFTTPDASGTQVERLRVSNGGNIQVDGANTVITQTRHFQLRSYTIAGLPAATTAGQMIYCSDLGGGAGQLNSDGTVWRRVSRGGMQTVATDAAFTLTVLSSAENQRHTGTLTADRAVTLSTSNAYSGARFRITRTGSGAFNLNVGTGPLKALATNTWAEFEYDGSAWYLAAYGAL